MEYWQNLQIEDLEGEAWKDVIDFEGLYKISNFGRVKSLPKILYTGKGDEYITKNRILKQRKDKNGYLCLEIYKNEKKYGKKVHRLVLEAFNFVDDYKNLQCNHINFEKDFNLLENLEWCSLKENIQHNINNNKHIYGEKSVNSKLTEQEVIEIYKLIEKGLSNSKISKLFNVTSGNIHCIRNNQTWKRTYEEYIQSQNKQH